MITYCTHLKGTCQKYKNGKKKSPPWRKKTGQLHTLKNYKIWTKPFKSFAVLRENHSAIIQNNGNVKSAPEYIIKCSDNINTAFFFLLMVQL